MKLVVCLKEVVDAEMTVGVAHVSDGLIPKGSPLKLNPNDAVALAAAIEFKKDCQNTHVEIIVATIGPKRTEEYLKDALAIGADSAVRIDWPAEERPMSPQQKSRVLARAVSVFDADLIVTGARSLDNASGQVGPFIAAWLDLPCVYEALSFRIETHKKSITAVRSASSDSREMVWCALPSVVVVANHNRELPYASVDDIVKSREAHVNVLSLTDLGMSSAQLECDHTKIIDCSFPRPRPRRVSTPDSSLPAFDRILALLRGGIPMREGEMLAGGHELVTQLFDLLLSKDVIGPPVPNGVTEEARQNAT